MQLSFSSYSNLLPGELYVLRW